MLRKLCDWFQTRDDGSPMWVMDSERNQYFLSQFDGTADLNLTNPDVIAEFKVSVLSFYDCFDLSLFCFFLFVYVDLSSSSSFSSSSSPFEQHVHACIMNVYLAFCLFYHLKVERDKMLTLKVLPSCI